MMFGAQLGKTAGGIENPVGYWMDEMPAPTMMMSATDDLLEEWVNLRLEPLIDSLGCRDKIVSSVNNAKSRRTGDKTMLKEFVGGFLAMCSAQSPGKQRSKSIRVLLRDEIDGAPAKLHTGEGNWLEVSAARTNAWGARKKIMDVSTPTTFERSVIFPLYQEGDRRLFQVPCPLCGKKQFLEFGNDKTQHGLKVDTTGGEITRAYYICEHCHDAFFNHHKTKMLLAGEWKPTTKSTGSEIRSYHMSSLYSPVGMLSWTDLYKKYLKAQEDPDGMRSFTTLYLGWPFKEKGSRPKLDNVVELRGAYKAGTVPDGVLYITIGIDVQRGSAKDPKNPARLELEVLGICAGFRTKSIRYERIEGAVKDSFGGAWAKLTEWANDGGLTFERRDGRTLSASLIFIDSGDGTMTDVVYSFTKTWVNTFPVKGAGLLKKNKKEDGDTVTEHNFKRYKPLKVDEDTTLYNISTNYYKTHIYHNLSIPRNPVDPQPPGFCDFPVDYPETYFKMLTAEEKRKDGSFHCPDHRRNEALDCRVYALCAADVYLDRKVLDVKLAAKEAGAAEADVQQITHRVVIDMMEKEANSWVSVG
jgi:phage terminase large subunit GpA-like protein